jgi:hypothetical protein
LKSTASNSPAPAASSAPAPGAPRELTTAPPRDSATVTIANIGDQDFYISRTYGIFHVPSCPKDEPYSLLLITARGDALDLGDNRRFPFTISAREIAADLIQDLVVHGVFVCAGARPSEHEIAAANARREAWYQELIAEADVMWSRGHSYREISDMHRRAAISLGVERDWAFVPQRLVECPLCGEKLKPGVAVCRHCKAVLDAERAAKHGIK